jgi:hypothetical protein
VGDQDTAIPGRPVSSGLKMSSETGNCHARTRPPWWPSLGFFPFWSGYGLISTPSYYSVDGWRFDGCWKSRYSPFKTSLWS